MNTINSQETHQYRDWVSIAEFVASPAGAQFFRSYAAFYWFLRRNRTRLIKEGVFLRSGRRFAISASGAPGVIESILREQMLEELKRGGR